MTASAPILSLRGISKAYVDATGARTEVLEGIDLDVSEGEFIAILGFSGSGKTTLISTIAGLLEPDSGEIIVKGQPSSGPGADRGLVFQSYSLFPWLTVEGNVRLAVEAVHKGLSKADQTALIKEKIELVGLGHAMDRKPAQLSGGMRQRVAVARALAMRPEILLLDEPLSALDALTRAKLQDEIERIRGVEKRTIILITNDVDEALLLADRVAVLEPAPRAKIGRIFDVGIARPRERTALNHDASYQHLRNEIVHYLGQLNQEQKSAEGDERELPKVTPISLLTPPKAYQDAARTNMETRFLEFFNLKKIYPTPKGPLTVVQDFNLLMDKGDFISLIGHSGCGKSTVLSMAAGLNEISGGGIILDGREIDVAGPDKAVVFQAPSLMPWLSARQNVSIGVERVYPHASKAERKDIVEYYLARVGLGDAMDKLAADMSNGMRQRVGIARAFALSPKLLLLDEPFGMLDSLTRWDLQDVLMEVWERTHVTSICVTHDVDEAILLADKVVMMTNGPEATIGKILEVDLPRPRDRKALLEHPKFYAYREEVLQFLADYEHGVKAHAA
ncbi:MAG: nitrate ABC transporter ATP-binding protein [Sphingobium sp.]|nr:ATP-binding cassette domain-containing protein [Sphingobium sp.]